MLSEKIKNNLFF